MPAVLSFDPTPRNTGPSRGPTAAKKLCYDHLKPIHIHERGKSWQGGPTNSEAKKLVGLMLEQGYHMMVLPFYLSTFNRWHS